MKKFNLKLITPLILTLLLQGCMPDSLTKFKKDVAKKIPPPPVTSPVVDSSGNSVDIGTLSFPTKFFYISEAGIPVQPLTVGDTVTISPTVDGTLADAGKRDLIFVRCELDQTGTTLSKTPPPGMQFNTSTCAFTGVPISVYSENDVPANVGLPINYKINLYYKDGNYTGVGTEAKISAQIKLASYLSPADMLYSQNDRLIIKADVVSGSLGSVTPNTNEALDYDRAGVITSASGVSGIVKIIDSNTSQIGLIKIVPLNVSSVASFSVNGFISAVGGCSDPSKVTKLTCEAVPGNIWGKKGKILKIDAANKILYVETLSPNLYFAAGNSIDNVAVYAASKATISSIASNYNFQKTNSDRSLDNDFQYYSNKFLVNTVIQTYEVNRPIIDITPIYSSSIATSNGVAYSITPALPNANANIPDLTFSSSTGIISGKFTSIFPPTIFTITATNLLGSTTSTIALQATQSPQSLSYTTRELITVNSNASFLENEALYQPLVAPLTTNVKGRILRKYGTTQLSIDTFNGAFLAGASLDSGGNYYSEKAYIDPTSTTPATNYNLALTVVDSSGISLDDTITGAVSGASARVVGKNDAFNLLFVQFLAPSLPVKTFIDTEAVGATTITQIESNNMILGFLVAPIYLAGQDLTSSTSDLSGYIYDRSGNSIYVSDIVKKAGIPYFTTGQMVANNETYALGTTATISSISHDNFYIAERNVPIEIQMNLFQGAGVIFSSSPILPPGLKINSSTGKISGTPTVVVPRKDYIISAKNLLGSSTFVLSLEVRDYFKVLENSGAPSFNLHKVGSSEHYRDCKINATDITNSTGALDVRCFLDAEEEDLHFTSIKFNASVGAGVCEYLEYVPFNFYQYAPLQTGSVALPVNVTDIVGDPCGGVPSPWVHTADRCFGNWAMNDGPLCDQGAFNVTTQTSTVDPVTSLCTTTSVTATVLCGGSASNCMAGPVRDLLSDAQIQKGSRAMIYLSADGASQSWTLTSPSDKIDLTNLRVASGTVKNACLTSVVDAQALEDKLAGIFAITQPHGASQPFYTFNCLDAAKEIKARIRLNVRDWNRTFTINSNLDVNIPGLMNDAGSAFGKPYNDYKDWDDNYNGAAVNYSGGTCAAPVITQDYRFPEDGI